MRVKNVRFVDEPHNMLKLVVELMDGRIITAPVMWYPRLLNATPEQRANWEPSGGGYGIHWPDVDEDLSVEGLMRGAPSPEYYRDNN